MGSPSSTEGPKLGCQVSPTQPNPLRPPILPDQLARFLHHSPPPPPPQHPSNNPFLNLPAFPASSGPPPPPRLHHNHHLLQHGFSLPKNEAAAVMTGGAEGDADRDRRRGLFPSAPPPPPPHQQAQAPPHQGSFSTASSPLSSVAKKLSQKVSALAVYPKPRDGCQFYWKDQ